jgi:hypothetical protein
VDGKSLGSIIQKNLTLQLYIPQLRLDAAYKGFTLFGVGVARPDTLGSALITAAYS